ncbi:hypothetical protein ACFY7H_00560 [Streptomyces sp. NPDC012794]|uniref:hypothetical protein n=1 Tax=Streptomyces sp. NPDC012794 TaxID=3364850 RepID=UPI00369F6A2D
MPPTDLPRPAARADDGVRAALAGPAGARHRRAAVPSAAVPFALGRSRAARATRPGGTVPAAGATRATRPGRHASLTPGAGGGRTARRTARPVRTRSDRSAAPLGPEGRSTTQEAS